MPRDEIRARFAIPVLLPVVVETELKLDDDDVERGWTINYTRHDQK